MKQKLKIYFFFLYLFIFLGNKLAAADIQRIGVPYVQGYTKEVYQAGNQNWAIAKDRLGVMYFANSEGLMAFDGKYWQLYRMPHGVIVRAVATDKTGKVFTGGFGEFGFWAYNATGNFKYTSLINLIPEKDRPQEEIWKIYVDEDRVLFQSFGSIYIYQNGKITVRRAGQPYLFLLQAGKRFFVEVINEGLYELKGVNLVPVDTSGVLGKSGILSVLPFSPDTFLIGTAKDGLFIYDGQQLKPWENQANNFLKTYQLNNGAFIQGEYFAFGTILNGIIIINRQGNIVQRINKSSGLQNNTVLSLYTDQEQNIWAGLDNGIDRIEVNSPLYFYFDKTGLFGTVYASIIYGNKIYLGTNQGLFYSDWENGSHHLFQEFNFKLIPNSQGQVWDLSVIDGQLLCGHNHGTFRVQGTTLEKISAVNGGWTIKKLKSNPNLLIQGTYNGLVFYKKDATGNWVFSHILKGFGEPSRYVEQDAEGNLWVSHAYKGLYKISLSNDLQKARTVVSYDANKGLPEIYHLYTFNLDNRLVFSSDKGFYLYDNIADRFFPFEELNKRLGYFASSNKIIPAGNKKYWFINNRKVALADLGVPGKITVNATPFNMLEGRMVQYYENISRISNSLYLISVDAGFVIYNFTSKPLKQLSTPTVLIRKVENITGRPQLITALANPVKQVELPYNQSNLRISFALPYYQQGNIQYQYLLEGYTRQWSDWSNDTQKDFTNLPFGDYQFRVRAQVNGKIMPDEAAFTFTILPPWYWSKWAYVGYVILLLALAFLFRYLYQLKLERDKKQIAEKLEREKQAFLRQEAFANEQEIIRLKNEQLQADLASKSRELANSALNIVYKNELLQNIEAEMKQLKDAMGKKLPEDYLRKIQHTINEGKTDERDWNLFEKSFNEAHENYFKKLKANHPELTPNDLKLCAYLRMNMSSKEIASLLNITVRGVEIRRYRLRKKLNLEHDKNLVEFLLEV